MYKFGNEYGSYSLSLLEDFPERVEAYASCAGVIVFKHDFLYVFLRDFLAELSHRRFDVDWGDIAVPLSIELLEDCNEALVGDDLLNRDGSGKELGIIYFILTVVIDFANNAVDFLLIVLDFSKLKGCFQVTHGNMACLVLIHPGEGSTKNLDVLRISSHLNQDIKSRFLEG